MGWARQFATTKRLEPAKANDGGTKQQAAKNARTGDHFTVIQQL
jgi:hypothetical protein